MTPMVADTAPIIILRPLGPPNAQLSSTLHLRTHLLAVMITEVLLQS